MDEGYAYCSGTKLGQFIPIFCLLLLSSHLKPRQSEIWLHRLSFLTDRGLGLAMWKSAESYIDVQHIINKVGEDTFTALHNPREEACTDEDCDEQLVH